VKLLFGVFLVVVGIALGILLTISPFWPMIIKAIFK
jgi:hypothetical protein